ncbi:hypothetical protein SAY87_014005 [Trapa incisa]|uniref:Uncharacterized protein n=1 Tax=Trapa incisa TaxID=236973 RepID=A0AAN7GZI4_9MYRT|nr:hypothetical protein SAY87_014005 [Trapa incisa]
MAIPDPTLHLDQSTTSAANERGMNVNGCYHIANSKFRRRKVSAIRDFPPGCGRFAARITTGLVEGSNDVAGIRGEENIMSKNTVDLCVQCTAPQIVDKCQNAGVSEVFPTEPLQGVASTEEPGRMDGVDDKLVSTGVKQMVLLKELDSVELIKPEGTSKLDIYDVSLDLLSVDLSDAKKDMIHPNDSIDCHANSSLRKYQTHKYPPRGRASAVRGFPPFCGRNAPILRKEGFMEKKGATFLKDNGMGDEKPLKDGQALMGKQEVDAKEKEECFHHQDSQKGEVDGNALSGGCDTTQVNQEQLAIVLWKKADERKGSLEMIIAGKDMEHNYSGPPRQSNQKQVSVSEETMDNSTCIKSGNPTSKEIVKYSDVKVRKRNSFNVSRPKEDSMREDSKSEHSSKRVTVLGLVAAPNSSWQHRSRGRELPLENGLTKTEGLKRSVKSKSSSRKKKSNGEGSSKGKSKNLAKGHILHQEPSYTNTDEMVVWETDNPSELVERTDDFCMSMKPQALSVNPPPFGQVSLGEVDNKNEIVTRNKVRETLRLFQAVCRKLLQEEETKLKQENRRKRVDLQAAKILKSKGRFVNTGKLIIGIVPGVEVGDEFQYRIELNIIGLHRALQSGIDYVNHGGQIIATSVVSSGAYEDVLEHSDFLIYTGQGGNIIENGKEPEDQKLERGNLALSNSISMKNPVRVIRGLREARVSDSSESKHRTSILYTYDGLYFVEKIWQEAGQHGKLVFKFRLNRIPGQPELAWKMVKKSKSYGVREGLCASDISQGKETVPIGAVNTIDDEKPPPFKYIAHMIYPDWCSRLPLVGCNCSNGCSDSEKCSCAVKNGGEIPYNFNGAIVEAKPLVYECGPTCKCPLSCHNRVSQRGITFPLEIFKTKSRGWGVRSLKSIPSGSFICEYIGELLDDKQAEERVGNDEYLFDIGNSYNDNNMHENISCLIPDAHTVSLESVEEVGFTIDAAKEGNVGRFINHSCSPNLYAQNVLYDHDDKRIPHIMFFSAENIPPLQELTYHYNYTIDQVRDSNGNIKMKSCFCGSAECIGRMY